MDDFQSRDWAKDRKENGTLARYLRIEGRPS
jgi:hypothetical protein